MAIALVGLGALACRWQRTARLRTEEAAQLRRALRLAEEQHHEALFQARAQMQTLFNSMVEGVMLLDREGRVQLVNQSLERQFQLLLDVRGLTVLEALRRQDLGTLCERLKSTHEVVSAEVQLEGPPSRWFEVNAASILGREGQPQGALLVFHDLTRIRQLEATRREFVANVSHELRTPLSLIKGFAETLLNGAREDPAVAVRFLKKIERHADRLNNLIEDLLTISKLESGQVSLKLGAVEVRELAQRLSEDLQSRAAQKKVTITNEIPPGLRALVDLDRLHQVFFNLLDNAIKYGKNGGHILLSGRPLNGDKVQLCVGDDGPGIPDEARERIFERFYRVDKARSRDTGGTGLGLSIVKHIVQSHGGEVWVENQPGQGTQFHFTLPRAPAET